MFSRIISSSSSTDLYHSLARARSLTEICMVSFHTGHYIVFKVGSGETPITIQEGEVHSSSTRTILFSDALEETRLKLIDRQVKAGEIQTDDGVTYFEFIDLDGNRFEVCHFLSV